MTSAAAAKIDIAIEPTPKVHVGRAACFFGLVYFSQGICQLSALINQPVRQYLEKVHNFNASKTADFLFIVGIPWIVKPLYGLLSDFFPILGYRRKSYLMLLNLAAAGAFFLVTQTQDVNMLLIMLTLTGVGVAASDVVVDAMMVQAAQQTGRGRLFQGAQWFSYYIAAIFSGWLASKIIERAADPGGALRTSASIAMAVPLLIGTIAWFFVKEPRAHRNVAEFKATARSLLLGFTDSRLWVIVGFLFLLHFYPGMQTPMYVHLEKNVNLPHSSLAILDMWRSAGTAAGCVIFMMFMSGRLSIRWTAVIGIVLGATAWLAMLFIEGENSAAIAYAYRGLSYMIASLAQLALAAEVCPKRVEAVVFSALMSVSNFGMQWSDKVGAKMYETTFEHRIEPLIYLSAAFMLAGFFLVPFLPRTSDKN